MFCRVHRPVMAAKADIGNAHLHSDTTEQRLAKRRAASGARLKLYVSQSRPSRQQSLLLGPSAYLRGWCAQNPYTGGMSPRFRGRKQENRAESALERGLQPDFPLGTMGWGH